MKEFFGLDHFWGKTNFFEKKTLLWNDFEEGIELEPSNLEGRSHIFMAPDNRKKNSRISDSCENYGRFSTNLT